MPRRSGEETRQLVALALRASARTWDDLAGASIGRHRQSRSEYQEMYTLVMASYGYRMRALLTLGDFTSAMAIAMAGASPLSW